MSELTISRTPNTIVLQSFVGSSAELNQAVQDTKAIAESINFKIAQKAFRVDTISSGHELTHDFHKTLGLDPQNYFLETRSYDEEYEPVSGIKAVPSGLDKVTILFTGDAPAFTGILVIVPVLF